MVNKQRTYKKWTLLFLIITVAALVVCAANLNLKRDIVAAYAAPLGESSAQSYNDYYSSKEALSQETGTAGKKTERNRSNSSAASESSHKNTGSSSEKPVSYLVTIYEGKIGVFENGDKSAPPFLTADVNVYLLPEADQKLLKKGIEAKSFAAVKGILEDYR